MSGTKVTAHSRATLSSPCIEYISVQKHAIQTNGNEKKPKLPSPFARGPYLIHPSLDRPHSPPQTASRSNQPCCHNIHFPDRQTDRPTDRQTDRWDRRQLCTKSAFVYQERLRSRSMDSGRRPKNSRWIFIRFEWGTNRLRTGEELICIVKSLGFGL